METISITLPTSKKRVDVRLDRKPMKTCRLKVYPSQEIVLSVPERVPTTWAEDFLIDKGIWIESLLKDFLRLLPPPVFKLVLDFFLVTCISAANMNDLSF